MLRCDNRGTEISARDLNAYIQRSAAEYKKHRVKVMKAKAEKILANLPSNSLPSLDAGKVSHIRKQLENILSELNTQKLPNMKKLAMQEARMDSILYDLKPKTSRERKRPSGRHIRKAPNSMLGSDLQGVTCSYCERPLRLSLRDDELVCADCGFPVSTEELGGLQL